MNGNLIEIKEMTKVYGMGNGSTERSIAVHALRGLHSIVHGFATLEISGGFGMPLDADESFFRLVDWFVAELEEQKLER